MKTSFHFFFMQIKCTLQSDILEFTFFLKIFVQLIIFGFIYLSVENIVETWYCVAFFLMVKITEFIKRYYILVIFVIVGQSSNNASFYFLELIKFYNIIELTSCFLTLYKYYIYLHKSIHDKVSNLWTFQMTSILSLFERFESVER